MAQLRENRVKHKLQRGEAATVVLGYNTADIIDFLGPLGFDGVWIEGEHGPVDFADIPDLTRACDLWGMTSVVRVNLNVPGVIYRTLDGGAQGIVVPHVNTANEARAVVEAAKFSPIGSRGMYTSRQGHGVSDYLSRANDETLIVVLIEDIVAINNLPEILSVEHIDVFSIAPSDLAQSMGYLGQTGHPDVLATIDRAIGQITSAGRVAGALVNDATAEEYINKGVRFLCNSWPAWLAAGARGYLEKVSSASRRA
ncbi:MAG: aldolase/citrate lyase family protein [Chloroflexota bacterium]